MAMNVLVYSGPEVIQTSSKNAMNTLRQILLPHYSVQSVTHQALSTQPWNVSCALLVFPRLRHNFASAASKSIQSYVEKGGAFLSFGTIMQTMPGSSDILSKDSLKDSTLRFHDKSTNSNIFLSLHADYEDEPVKAVNIRTPDNSVVKGIREIGEKGFESVQLGRFTALGWYENQERSIAGVSFDIGVGKIAFWAAGLEFFLTEETAGISTSQKIDREQSRFQLFRTTLLHLGLQVPSFEDIGITRPLPQFLTSNPSKPTIVTQIIDAIATPSVGSQLSVFKDANDTFHFHLLEEAESLLKEARAEARIPSDSSSWQPKHIVVCRDGQLPRSSEMTHFNIRQFFESLTAAREREGCSEIKDLWGLGEALLYGEAVTSTQTMLDKNARLLRLLPTPFLSLASNQLAGRGRGSNVWLSPSGCLQFSILLRVSLSAFPARNLVFVQYLFALAVVEACRDETVLGTRGSRIRLKWPNDLYALVGSTEEKKKIGGILVNTSFTDGQVDIIIGCGLNVLNSPPITSLSQLLPPEERKLLTLEQTAAIIMAKFEIMWTTFVAERGSFDSFLDLYLKRWLHSDQLVTLTTATPPIKVRITGITPDHGLLRTLPERAGWSAMAEPGFIDLQPDGNSFDLMSGMIRSKS